MKNSFKNLEEKIVELEQEDYKLTRSTSEYSDEDLHFHFYNNIMEPQKGLKMFQTERKNRNQTPGVGVVLQ